MGLPENGWFCNGKSDLSGWFGGTPICPKTCISQVREDAKNAKRPVSHKTFKLPPRFHPALPCLHSVGSSSVGSLPRPSVRGAAKRPRLLLTSVSLADVDRMIPRYHKISQDLNVYSCDLMCLFWNVWSQWLQIWVKTLAKGSVHCDQPFLARLMYSERNREEWCKTVLHVVLLIRKPSLTFLLAVQGLCRGLSKFGGCIVGASWVLTKRHSHLAWHYLVRLVPCLVSNFGRKSEKLWKFVWAFLSPRDVTERFAHQLGKCSEITSRMGQWLQKAPVGSASFSFPRP